MTENEILLSHTAELKVKAEENSMITATNFLTAEQINNIIQLEKRNNKYVSTFYYGGYENAERVMCVFIPAFFDVDDIHNFFLENPDENPLSLIKIKKDPFSNLSHRDYLGSVMGLGIEREMIGDIVVTEGGAFIFCVKRMTGYICENLIKAGRGKIECFKVNVSDFINTDEKAEEIFVSVASLRLDNILSAAFNLSRSSASSYIKQGSVYVNNKQILKSDFTVKEEDKVVLRGKGKSVLKQVKGETKKGRIHLVIKRYK